MNFIMRLLITLNDFNCFLRLQIDFLNTSNLYSIEKIETLKNEQISIIVIFTTFETYSFV